MSTIQNEYTNKRNQANLQNLISKSPMWATRFVALPALQKTFVNFVLRICLGIWHSKWRGFYLCIFSGLHCSENKAQSSEKSGKIRRNYRWILQAEISDKRKRGLFFLQLSHHNRVAKTQVECFFGIATPRANCKTGHICRAGPRAQRAISDGVLLPHLRCWRASPTMIGQACGIHALLCKPQMKSIPPCPSFSWGKNYLKTRSFLPLPDPKIHGKEEENK